MRCHWLHFKSVETKALARSRDKPKAVRPIKFERFRAVSILTNVKWLRTMAVLTLAVLWLPVSVHCQLEQIPGLEFLSCCDHEDTSGPHQDDDCAGDACAVLESGLYKLEEHQVPLPAPASVGAALAAFPTSLASDSAAAGALVRGNDPPDFPRPWQFTSRAALPPRAPSFAS
jgi:hypothetical protein